MAVLKADSQWGSKFYESLSKDLKAEFPDMKGFSLQIWNTINAFMNL